MQKKTICQHIYLCLPQIGEILPMVSNHKKNAYLKDVAYLCGITKMLTFHIARHTFATIVIHSNSLLIYAVSKVLGQKSTRKRHTMLRLLMKM